MSEKLASKADHKRKGYKASTSSSRNSRRSNTRPSKTNYSLRIKKIPGAPDYVNKAYEKAGQSRELTNRYKLIIKSVDGKSERKDIDDFVDNQFMARDSIAFRDYIADVAPDIDFTTKVKLADGSKQEVTVPMTVRFFWPNATI